MSTEYESAANGYFVNGVDECDALTFKTLNNNPVVNDFMKYINGGPHAADRFIKALALLR